MSIYKKIFKQTAIYGLAAVFPKVIGFFLVPFHTDLMKNDAYGQYSVIFSIMMFLNVILSFGMETAFFRFYNKKENKQEVVNNSLLFLTCTTLVFACIGLLTIDYWVALLNIPIDILQYVLGILILDALVIVPFAKLRADQRPVFYSIIRIANVCIYTFLNVFFLYLLPLLSTKYPNSVFQSIYIEDYQVSYIFIANLTASLFTFLVFYKDYLNIKLRIDKSLIQEMLKYSFPIMIGGLAFAINESFDKILLERLLPADIALSEVGKYAACYKLGLFMVLFRQAYTLGIEPFFFNYAKNDDAPTKYATITKYFTIFGSAIMLGVIVFSDILKVLFIRNESYWDAMIVVPLIILANLCMGIYTNLSVWYKLRDKTMVGAYISILGAILTLVFNYLLIPIWGYMGSAIATLIAYGSMMLISYVLGQKHYPIPYDKKAITGYMGLSILLSFIYFYCFRENYFIGIGTIIIFGIVICINERNMLKMMLKR
ncbi:MULTISPECIES: lipopolysaccharide biosynthesis protein [Myroides]|uniref:Oligosaccharide flippase family protein n=1 Tax=Myroides albus TaxID=2562892 RepID=A0A6I3LJJ6_9FLAO|nr:MULTISPECIES: oligosaccharide flippase family protein [Myroides]MTG96651.1 oligosaccharide flippase family protein [Myroides albus]MVX34766.1 oligosaccharide flippase family protein [Myroides sp. LoEW2-1]UVD80936.1 oligosaccharide flippase family protein [Myroides albus]